MCHQLFARPATGNDDGFLQGLTIFLLADRVHRPKFHQQIIDQQTQPRPGRAMREGYPEQAGTLAASVFELAHTALFLELDADKATEWLGAGSIEDQMPREVLGTNWREVVRLNTRDSGDVTVAEREYQVYISLCWMKHSLPKMQDMRVESDGKVGLIFGPYSDERSIC